MNNIELIKSIDIRSLIMQETGLNFKRNTLEHCPLCKSGEQKGGTSAFSIKPSHNIFKCFSCDKKGNPIEFICFYKGLESRESIDYIANKYTNLPKYEAIPEKLTDFSKRIFAISKNSKKIATEYLESRNITTSKLPSGSYFYERYSESVVFVDSEKTLINKRIISPKEGSSKVLQVKGSILKNALYTQTYQHKKETVFITEGVINALSFYPHSALAIFSTSNLFTDKAKLRKYLEGKNVVLAFDNDPPNKNTGVNVGEKCTEYYSNFILGSVKTKSLSSLNLPQKVDVNDLLIKGELKEFLENTDNYDFKSVDILTQPLPQNSKNKNKDFRKYGFYVENSQYWVKKSAHEKQMPLLISDCVIEILYRLNNEEGTRLVKVQQEKIKNYQRRELFEIPSEDLAKDRFKKILYTKGLNFIGTQANLDRILMYNTHREKESEIIETYGWQAESKMFVFADCAVNTSNEVLLPNSIGMILDNKKRKLYYVPSASPANKVKLKTLREEFSYTKGELNFEKFAELFYLSNKQNGSIGTMFYLLSLFRDIVVKHLDFFPYLFLYGTAGGGKTSYAEILTALFGDSSKGVDLKNITQPSLSRIASQKRNTITYYKEYKTDAQPYVEQYFKAGYDCVSRTISSGGTGTETLTFNIESSGLLDSNFLPTNEEAVFSRMIIADFEKATFTDEQKEAFMELKKHKELGLAQITKEILQFRSLFEDNFKEVYYDVLDELKKGKMKDFKDRERAFKHVALILTPLHILQSVIKFPFDIETLENIMVSHAEAQYAKLNEFKSTAMFWQSFAYWESEGRIKEYGSTYGKNKAHYVKRIISEKKGIIYLKSTKFSDLHTYYVSYCKSKGIPFISLPELKNELFSVGYEAYMPNVKNRKKVQNNSFIGSSYAFSYDINHDDENITINGTELDI